ncbi:MAG: tRNA (5-methylaminomethyl-2-thiouridine)(34)-methyltransferase MnmD [Bacteroidia bacterium]|nr:tRNA (5-methylaminomethyl-2-thiouridine)(34)-methyltransferase MnmD [Bacteroidia bacterium]
MEEKDSHPISFLVTDDHSHTLFSERFKATYHSTRGAISESKHVFIQNGLQYVHEQFQLKEISILEIGFGTGLNCFLTYLYAKVNALKINYQSIEAYPVPISEADQLNYTNEFSEHEKVVFNQMHMQEWNRVGQITDLFSLTKHLCLVEEFQSQQQFDVIYFDAFSPSEQPELWTEAIFTKMYNLLKVNSVLVTYSAQGQMKRNMRAAGFKVQSLTGALGKREMTRGLR